jgi:hypothetical protein
MKRRSVAGSVGNGQRRRVGDEIGSGCDQWRDARGGHGRAVADGVPNRSARGAADLHRIEHRPRLGAEIEPFHRSDFRVAGQHAAGIARIQSDPTLVGVVAGTSPGAGLAVQVKQRGPPIVVVAGPSTTARAASAARWPRATFTRCRATVQRKGGGPKSAACAVLLAVVLRRTWSGSRRPCGPGSHSPSTAGRCRPGCTRLPRSPADPR